MRGTEIPSLWWLRFPAFAAPVAAGLQKADRCPCSASAVSSAGRASASQSLGTKFGTEPRTRPISGSHTLSAKFPCMCPDRTHMSSGRDFFDSLSVLQEEKGPQDAEMQRQHHRHPHKKTRLAGLVMEQPHPRQAAQRAEEHTSEL